jgi:penicillin-binding protein 2
MNRSDSLQNNLPTWRILALPVMLVLVFLIYTGRLFLLQIVQTEQWLSQADDNRTDTINVPAPRGIIYDRNGAVLARNIPSYNVVITPVELPEDPGETQRVFRELSALIDLPVNLGVLDNVNSPYVPCFSEHGITQIVEYGDTTAPFTPVTVKCDVSREIAMIILEKSSDWPGVSVEIEPLRDYPTGSLTANIIGYLGPISAENEDFYVSQGFVANRDKVGYSGLERAYQSILAGSNGIRTVELDAAGEVQRDLKEPAAAVPGYSLELTLDTRLQQAATSILIDEINLWNQFFRDRPDRQMTSGVVIAMNPTTGEILAMVSWPSYENNRLARFIPAYYYEQLTADATKPLLNHAVGDNLPAGSVFKLTTAVGALNEGIVSPETVVETPGVLFIEEHFSANDPGNQRRFVDWNWQSGGFGQLDFLHCIANSSNVCFYKIGGGFEDEIEEGLGICRLGAYARALGYGSLPGTGLPEEAEGLVPDPEYKRITGGESWTLGDTYIVSVGQGFVLATPLQVLMSAATIANDGKLMNPTLVREIIDGEGRVVQAFEPDLRWDLTVNPVLELFNPEITIRGCESTGEYKTVAPSVFENVQQGMRLAVLEGTLTADILGLKNLEVEGLGRIAVAGKTGTAEYCDDYAKLYHICGYGNWPSHAWTVAYAPYDNPEIAVVAWVYNGNEGASVAGPIVRRVLQSYFELKVIDMAAEPE